MIFTGDIEQYYVVNLHSKILDSTVWVTFIKDSSGMKNVYIIINECSTSYYNEIIRNILKFDSQYMHRWLDVKDIE